jgi:hypothetical protein
LLEQTDLLADLQSSLDNIEDSFVVCKKFENLDLEYSAKKPKCIGVIMVNAECGIMETTEEQISGLRMVIDVVQLGEALSEMIRIVDPRTTM